MNFTIKVDPATWQHYISTPVKGKALLMDPFTNKGTAFTARERDELDLHGLLPPQVSTIEMQLERVYENFQAKSTPLEKFIYMASLQDRNETLFFRLCHERIDAAAVSTSATTSATPSRRSCPTITPRIRR